MGEDADNLDLLDPDTLRSTLADTSHTGGAKRPVVAFGLPCPKCRDVMRVKLELVHAREGWDSLGPKVPTHFHVQCVQCLTDAPGVLVKGPAGPEVVIHWPIAGGISTPNTPPSVAYYLDQAARCDSAGANSAAAAMYRSALEHLLHEQGHERGMLNDKIQDLLAAVGTDKAKKWARDLDPTYLDMIKQIGNGAIHTNGGDVTKQAALDRGVLDALRVTMSELLEVVYERPVKEAARLDKLKAAAETMKK